MPTRRTSFRRSRRLSGGDLKQYQADKKAAIERNAEGFHSGGRFYERGPDNVYRCVENCGTRKKLSQSKAAKAERQAERMRRSSAKKAREVARKAAAAGRKKMSDKKKAAAAERKEERKRRSAEKKAAAAERAFQREVRRMSGPKEKVYKPCKEYQIRNEEGRCVGKKPKVYKPCKEYQTRNAKGRCVGRGNQWEKLEPLMGGRKVRTGPRGGRYVLKGGKKVYL